MKTADLLKDPLFHGLIYGPSGAGKTFLLGILAKVLGETWINDSDFKIGTLAGLEGITYEQWYDRPGEKKPQAWDSLMKFVDEQIKNPIYKLYGFDSFTTLAECAGAKVVARTSPGRDIIQFQDYTSIYALLTQFMVKIRRIKAHVILTAHEEDTRDDRGKRKIQPLVLGQKFTPRVPIYWPNVWHLSVEPAASEGSKPARALRVQSDGVIMASSTTAKSDSILIQPTASAIFSHLGFPPPGQIAAPPKSHTTKELDT